MPDDWLLSPPEVFVLFAGAVIVAPLLFVVVTRLVVAVLPCTPLKERSNFGEVAVLAVFAAFAVVAAFAVFAEVAVACLASNSMTARGVGAGARASSNLGGQAKHGAARIRAVMIELVGRMAGKCSGEGSCRYWKRRLSAAAKGLIEDCEMSGDGAQ